MSPLITITGTLGGPFILKPTDDIRALTVFPNNIVAAAFARQTGIENIAATPIQQPSFADWLKHVDSSGITHVAIVPYDNDHLNLVPIASAIFIDGVARRW